MSRFGTIGQQLYSGRISYDFVGRRRLWYAISVLIMLAAAAGLLVRGVNLGIEFKGGVEFTATIAPTQDNVDKLTLAAEEAGVADVQDPIVTTSGSDAIRVQTPPLSQDEATVVQQALERVGAQEVSQDLIGPTWGQQVANKALTGLLVFVALVVVFIWAYFREWKMSAAAIVALAHDLVITIGVYAWSGFEVTPATVTGLLTILGYSLYDTVVVFDKVRENTRRFAEQTQRTWGEQANLAVNQTLVRSINTSVTALLPVAALLVVGTVVLGTGPLKDLALALLVGMAAGTYSSIFIATPLAVGLKEREEDVRKHAQKVQARRAREQREQPVLVGAGVGGPSGGPGGGLGGGSSAARGGASPARPGGTSPARSGGASPAPPGRASTTAAGGASPARPGGAPAPAADAPATRSGATAASTVSPTPAEPGAADPMAAPEPAAGTSTPAAGTPTRRPMSTGGSSGRVQPQRGTRSSRGKGRR